jgi:hypothetical protein
MPDPADQEGLAGVQAALFLNTPRALRLAADYAF